MAETMFTAPIRCWMRRLATRRSSCPTWRGNCGADQMVEVQPHRGAHRWHLPRQPRSHTVVGMVDLPPRERVFLSPAFDGRVLAQAKSANALVAINKQCCDVLRHTNPLYTSLSTR